MVYIIEHSSKITSEFSPHVDKKLRFDKTSEHLNAPWREMDNKTFVAEEPFLKAAFSTAICMHLITTSCHVHMHIGEAPWSVLWKREGFAHFPMHETMA